MKPSSNPSHLNLGQLVQCPLMLGQPLCHGSVLLVALLFHGAFEVVVRPDPRRELLEGDAQVWRGVAWCGVVRLCERVGG